MRSIGLSVLKTISCFSAVTFYSTSQLCNELCFVSGTTLSILYFLSIIATPLFFLVNGYADTDYMTNKIDWRKVIAVLFIFFFWNIVGFFTLNKVAQNSYFLQSWLLISLASIYLLNPIFTHILNNEKIAIYAILLFVLVMLGLDILSFFRKRTLLSDIPNYFRVWTWFFYYFLGRFLALRKWRLFTKKTRLKRIARIGIIPVFILMYFYEKLIAKYIFKHFNAGYFLDSIIVILATVFLFIIFDNFKPKSKWVYKIFNYTAPAMIGVYILHDAVFFYVNKIYPADNVFIAAAYLIAVFSISVIISRLIMINKWTAKLVSV